MDAYLEKLNMAIQPVFEKYSAYRASLLQGDTYYWIGLKSKEVITAAATAIKNVKKIPPYQKDQFAKPAYLKLLNEIYHTGKKKFPKINEIFSEKTTVPAAQRKEYAEKKLADAMIYAIAFELDMQKKNRLFYRHYYADAAASDFCMEMTPLHRELPRNFINIKGDSVDVFIDGTEQYRIYESTLPISSSPTSGRVIHRYSGDTLKGASVEYYFYFSEDFDGAVETFDIITLFFDACYPDKADLAFDESETYGKQQIDEGYDSAYIYRFDNNNSILRAVLRLSEDNGYLVFIDLSYGFYP